MGERYHNREDMGLGPKPTDTLSETRDKRRCPFPPTPELTEKEDLEVIEHRRGDGWVREYVGSAFSPPTQLFGKARYDFQDAKYVHDIEYISRDGNRLRLSELLPKGYRFLKTPREDEGTAITSHSLLRYGQFIKRERVDRLLRIRMEKEPLLESRGGMLVILHEVAHAHQDVPKNEEKYAQTLIREGNYRTFTDTERRAFFHIVLQRERDAWAQAIMKLRELRERGVDLEPELDTPEKLELIIHGALHSYEEFGMADRKNLLWVVQRRRQMRRAQGSPSAVSEFVHESIRPKKDFPLDQSDKT